MLLELGPLNLIVHAILVRILAVAYALGQLNARWSFPFSAAAVKHI